MVDTKEIDSLITLTGGQCPSGPIYIHSGVITPSMYQERKAVRQNKPGWREAPDWAHYLAQDSSGHWYWFSSEPHAGLAIWLSVTDKYGFSQSGTVIGDWRRTLELHPNHIVESDENANIDFELTAASVEPGLGGKLLLDKMMKIAGNAFAKHCQLATEECFALMRESKAKPDNSADWYDYDKQEATKLPPVGGLVEAAMPHTNGRDEKSVIWIEGRVIAYHEINGKQYAWFAEDGDNGFYPPNVLQFRPLDWNPKVEPNPEPKTSPELSFHLSNAFNELQASARLLPEDDPRRSALAGIAGAVNAVREVA